MSNSIRFISRCALLGLGLSGLVGCYGDTVTTGDEFEQTELTQEAQQPAEQEAAEPDVIVEESPVINVLNVTCLDPQDADGMDEPALYINGKKVWASAGFVAGTSEEVAYEERAFGKAAVVQIVEEDVWDNFEDPNDPLAHIEVPAGIMGFGPQIAEIEDKGVSYELVYQVDSCTNCTPDEAPQE